MLGVRKDGTPLPLELSVREIDHPDGVRFLGLIRDITGRKREDALYRAQAAAIEASQAVVEYGVDGTVRNANQRFLSVPFPVRTASDSTSDPSFGSVPGASSTSGLEPPTHSGSEFGGGSSGGGGSGSSW